MSQPLEHELNSNACSCGHQTLHLGGCRLNATTNERILFEGGGGTAAEDFIFIIKLLAAEQGKLGEDKHVALMASQCFVRSALRWYIDLDPEIQDSWRLLQKALMARWTSPESPETAQPQLSLTPFSLDRLVAPSEPRSRTGVIRIIKADGSGFCGYATSGASGIGVTAWKEEGLCVSYDPRHIGVPCQLSVADPKLADFECVGVFAMNFTQDAEVTNGYCYLSVMSESRTGLKQPSGVAWGQYPVKREAWVFARNSPSLRAVWAPGMGTSPENTAFFIHSGLGGSINFGISRAGYRASWAPPNWIEILLEFEERRE